MSKIIVLAKVELHRDDPLAYSSMAIDDLTNPEYWNDARNNPEIFDDLRSAFFNVVAPEQIEIVSVKEV